MNTKPPEIFTSIYARHGHRCPMSTLGGRLGLAAMGVAEECRSDMKLVYSNRTCALDGIIETTGCTEEAGSLIVKVDGRHALQVSNKRVSMEIELSAEALQIAGRYRSLCNRLEQDWDELDPDEQSRRRTKMEAMLDELLPQLWQADDSTLLLVRET